MDRAGQRNRRYRQSRRLKNHKRSILLISAVIILLGASVFVGSLSLQAKAKGYEVQMQELEEQIEAEKSRTKEIDELEKYVGTDEYVEEIARDKLGLVYKNEIVFKGK